MRTEAIKIILEGLKEEVTKKLRIENFAKKAIDKNIFTSPIIQEKMDNNEYYFGKEIEVECLQEVSVESRTILLKSIRWYTALNLKIGHNFQIQNDPNHYLTGQIDDLLVTYEYTLDGDLIFEFGDIKIQDFIEKRRN